MAATFIYAFFYYCCPRLNWGFLLLFFSFCAHQNTQAQSEQGLPFIHSYTSEDYDGHIQNWGIVKAADNLLYASNTDGYIRTFDGVSWRKISIGNRSIIRSLALNTAKDSIYVGGVGELGYLLVNQTGKTAYHSLLPTMDSSAHELGAVYEIVCLPTATFFQTPEVIYRYANGKMDSWSSGKSLFQSIFTAHGKVFAQKTDKKGLMVLVGDEWQPLPGGDRFADMRVRSMIPLSDHKILIATAQSGLFTLDYHSQPFGTIQKANAFTAVAKYLKDQELHRLHLLANGMIAFATFTHGLVVADTTGAIQYHITEDDGLPSNAIMGLCQDDFNNLHLATGNGIASLETFKPMSHYNARNGLDAVVLSMLERDSTLYVGTYNNGIFRLDRKRFSPINIQESIIWSMANFFPEHEAEKPRWIIGAHTGTYEVLAHETAKVAVLDNNRTHSLHQSKQHPQYLLAGQVGFLSIFHFANNSWQRVKSLPLPGVEIRVIAEDEAGVLWLGTGFKGVVRIEGLFEDGEPADQPKVAVFNKADGLPSLEWCHPAAVNGRLTVGTNKGLYAFRASDQRFVPDTLYPPSMYDGTRGVHYIAQDADANIWTVDLVPKNSPPAYLINQPDGGYALSQLPSLKRIEEGSLYNIHPGSNGVVWFGGTDGLYRYDRSLEKTAQTEYPCLVRKVTVLADSVVSWGKPPATAKVFSYTANSFLFEFAAPRLEAQDQVRYRYQLEGQEDHWSGWSKTTTQQYTNLWHGKYHFKVQAMDIYGQLSKIGSYHFTIAPPWFLSWWAYIMYLGFFSLTIWGIVQLNSKRLRQQKSQLENVVKQRTYELKQANESLGETVQLVSQQKAEIEAQTKELKAANQKLIELSNFKQSMTGMIVHDLKNSLNALVHLPENAPALQTQSVRQTGRQMLNMVLNILDVYKYEDVGIRIAPANLLLEDLIDLSIQQIAYLAEKKQITITQSLPENILVNADKELICRVLVNLLTNAIKYSPPEDTIRISCSVAAKQQQIRIYIQDNGPGIAKEHQHLIFEKFRQIDPQDSGSVRATGLGLAFCKLAVEAHNGNIGVNATPPKGSSFYFTLPLVVPVDESKVTTKAVAAPSQLLEEISFLSDLPLLFPEQLASLKRTKIYAISEIKSILAEMQPNHPEAAPALETWKARLLQAVYNGNKDTFNRLIHQPNEQQQNGR